MAPFNPATKTGHLLIEQAQSALPITFDGKPLSLQPFLNAVSADVTACHLQEAATICNNPTLPGLAATDPNINILTGYGNVTDEIMTFCFDDSRRNQIRGADDAGNPIDPNLLGADDPTKLRAQRDIQNIKILFHKLKKSFTTACGKTLLPKLAEFHEDGTKLLVFIVPNTQSTTSAAMRNAQAGTD